MTTEDKDRKKLSLSSGGTLSLGKTIETSQVKQSFSHGRSKTVQVERRRKRVAIVSNDIKDVEAVDENAPQNLTSEERAARTRALQVGLKQTDGTSEEVSSPHAKLILSEQGLSGDGERTAITVFPEPTEKAGKEARYLHKGMTSSDVLDTCFNLQLKHNILYVMVFIIKK